MFKYIKYFILSVLLISILGGVLFAYAVLDKSPIVYYETGFSDADLARAKRLLREHDPRRNDGSKAKKIALNENDANLLVNYALKKTPVDSQANVKFYADASYLSFSVRLPGLFDGYYVNASFHVRKTGASDVSLESLQLGSVELGAGISNWLAKNLYQLGVEKFPEADMLADSIQSIELAKNNIAVSYKIDKDTYLALKQRGTEYLIPQDMRNRLVAYQQALENLTRNNAMQKPSLIHLVRPMFVLSRQRSSVNHEMVEEHRAVLLTLGAYIVGRNINSYIDNNAGAEPEYINYTLNERDDLAKHFLVSAALVAVADNELASLVGLQKEVLDSQGGSGFSFADLAADRAGVKLAQLLLRPDTAATVLERMSQAAHESDFMPEVKQLPEGLQSVDFELAYKNTGSAEYKRVVSVIDGLIQSRQVFRGI